MHTLDMRRVVMYYLKKTKAIKKGILFFVAFANESKGLPVTKGTIARWIAQTI